MLLLGIGIGAIAAGVVGGAVAAWASSGIRRDLRRVRRLVLDQPCCSDCEADSHRQFGQWHGLMRCTPCAEAMSEVVP